MRTLSIVLALLLLALTAVALMPSAIAFQPIMSYMPYATVALAALVLLTLLAGSAKQEQPSVAAEAARPAPLPPATNQAEAEIVGFLATLQERGRLVDFLMDDVTAYSDAQVGAAARVVHQGCKAALKEMFHITPLREEAEGSTVTVPAGSAADEYRLSGKIIGQPPFSGKLTHRGWKTEWAKLPRVVRTTGDRLPAIAPAEVELK